jgi:hypothetical protein
MKTAHGSYFVRYGGARYSSPLKAASLTSHGWADTMTRAIESHVVWNRVNRYDDDLEEQAIDEIEDLDDSEDPDDDDLDDDDLIEEEELEEEDLDVPYPDEIEILDPDERR